MDLELNEDQSLLVDALRARGGRPEEVAPGGARGWGRGAGAPHSRK